MSDDEVELSTEDEYKVLIAEIAVAMAMADFHRAKAAQIDTQIEILKRNADELKELVEKD